MKKMEENKKIEEKIEYEEVRHLPLGAFVAIGLAFGLAAGFTVGNAVAGTFPELTHGFGVGMALSLVVGALGGLVLGIINNKKRNK